MKKSIWGKNYYTKKELYKEETKREKDYTGR